MGNNVRLFGLHYFTIAAFCFVGAVDVAGQTPLPDWAFGPFVRPADTNPVLSPVASSSFLDPMKRKKVAWESNDVFNPAATIKGDQIYVLYRAEDKSGIGIGERTSRIGLAETSDGLTMKRRRSPVVYPGNDDQKEFEWPGG